MTKKIHHHDQPPRPEAHHGPRPGTLDHHHDHDILHHTDRLYGELAAKAARGATLVIRPNSGLSGDILVAGLLSLACLDQNGLDSLLADMGLDRLAGKIYLEPRVVDGITGVGLHVELGPEHEHRTLGDMEKLFGDCRLSPRAKGWALKTFRLLAEAEGAVHGLSPQDVHFHEVGALDSIVDIGLAAALMDRLSPNRVISGPLPICDGAIECQHGLLPSPAPAVMRLMVGVPVVGLNSRGETITPTAIALLKAFGVEFGRWPAISIVRQALVYGTRKLEGVPNGAIFVIGSPAGEMF